MARSKSATLTEGEQRLMEVIWSRGASSVSDVVEALPKADRPAFNSVQTMMRIMEKKGYLRHEAAGRVFVYYPVVERLDAARAAVRNVLARFFDNSPGQLTVRLLEDEELSPDELARIRSLLDEASS